MCVNDLIVQGAQPLFFLDYISINKIELKKLKQVMKGILKGCQLASCDLVGVKLQKCLELMEKINLILLAFLWVL